MPSVVAAVSAAAHLAWLGASVAQSVERVVRAFYDRVRLDPLLSPIFAGAIPGDWEPHLQKMFAFWSSVMMMSGRYHGQPVPKHQALAGVTPAHFARWLELFEETASDLCEPAVAALFVDRAQMIAGSLKRAMFPEDML